MMNLRTLLSGFVLGFVLAGCGGVAYTYYNLDLPDECYAKGKLLGAAPKNDLPLSVCAPDPNDKMKCVHMLTDEFERLVLDKAKCDKDLIACEQKK